MPNCLIEQAPVSLRRVSLAKVPAINGTWARIRTLREASLQQVEDPKLFNAFLRIIRKADDLNTMKILLDVFLTNLRVQG